MPERLADWVEDETDKFVEMWRWRRIIGVLWKEHCTYESILNQLDI